MFRSPPSSLPVFILYLVFSLRNSSQIVLFFSFSYYFLIFSSFFIHIFPPTYRTSFFIFRLVFSSKSFLISFNCLLCDVPSSFSFGSFPVFIGFSFVFNVLSPFSLVVFLHVYYSPFFFGLLTNVLGPWILNRF
jgi:hypothetical protein